MSVLGPPCRTKLVEDSRLSCRKIVLGVRHQNRRCADLGSAEMLFICSDTKGKHSLSVFAVDCGPPFVAPSVVLVNTGKERGVMNKRKPGNRRWSPADLRGAWKYLRHLEHGQPAAVAEASRSENAISLRCVRTYLEELSAESQR